MITLAGHPTRAALRGFGVALALLMAALDAVLVLRFGASCLLGMLPAGALAVSAIVWPRALTWPYRAWNKAARLYVRSAESALLALAFYTVVAPAGGATGGMHTPARAAPSLWLACPDAGGRAAVRGRTDEGWIGRYMQWARASGRHWHVALLPYLILLCWLHPEEQATVSDNLYTLF
jgi:hypothetical protein